MLRVQYYALVWAVSKELSLVVPTPGMSASGATEEAFGE
jgi:hypothetical protein